MLRQMHELLTTPLPSRSIYRGNDQPVDIWRGMLLNIDGMAHEAYIEREALLGLESAIAVVRKCATSAKDPQARQRAAFILSKIGDASGSTGTGNGEVPQKSPRARKAPAKKDAGLTAR